MPSSLTLLRDRTELEQAIADLPLVYPSPEEYQADRAMRYGRPLCDCIRRVSRRCCRSPLRPTV
jgi:hypothetical protein